MSLIFVLLRLLLFRPAPGQHQSQPNQGAQASRLSLYDHLASNALSTIERLLHSLSHKPSVVIHHKPVDTIADLMNYSMQRGPTFVAGAGAGIQHAAESGSGAEGERV